LRSIAFTGGDIGRGIDPYVNIVWKARGDLERTDLEKDTSSINA